MWEWLKAASISTGSDLTGGNISLPRVLLNHGRVFFAKGVDAPSLTVFKRHLSIAPNAIFKLLVSPEVVWQLDKVTVFCPFQLNSLFYSALMMSQITTRLLFA